MYPVLNALEQRIGRMNLWTRLVLVLTTGFVLLFGVFSLLSLRILDDSTQRILSQREVVAQIVAQHYDELLTQAFYELNKATTFAAFDPAAPDLSNEVHMLAHAYGRLGSFSSGVLFLDPHGRVVLAEPGGVEITGADYSGFPFIAQVIQTGERDVSRPFRDPHTLKPAVAVTIPIRDPQGRLISMLSGWIDLTGPLMLTGVEQAMKLGETGHAELVDDLGTVIASTDGEADALTPGDHLRFYIKMLASRRTGVEDVPEESGPRMGEMHVMAFAPLQVTHWGIAIGATEAETFAPVRELQRDIFIFGALSFVVIFLATLWGARMLVRPVKALTDAAEGMAQGNLAVPIPVLGGGEIGTLAQSFEAMRVRVQQSHAEILAWSKELETRVKERTKELEELNTELQQQESERRQLLERVINAQEEERKRIARELHDETGQALTALLMSLEAVESNLPEIAAPLKQPLTRSKTLTENALRELRVIIHDLRPSILDDLGLVPAIRRFAEERLEPLDLSVSLETRAWPRERLPSATETVLFRVMQEAINNVARHAQACRVLIVLEGGAGELVARVQDDGQGFNIHARRDGWGLVGMRERVNLVGGCVEVKSEPEAGTQVEIRIPLPSKDGTDE